MTWAVERFAGSAGDFHARELPEPMVKAAWVFDVDRLALVLGSTQRADVVRPVVDVEVVRRRSGGGAVLVAPDELLWVDVLVPRGDPRWDDDVGRSAHWLGEVWVEALAATGVARATVHGGPMVRTAWSSLVCFAGVGPGEVTVGNAKIVGISQRRTRAGARFQCAAYARWDPAALVELLADPRPSAAELGGCVATVPEPLGELEAAFLRALALR